MAVVPTGRLSILRIMIPLLAVLMIGVGVAIYLNSDHVLGAILVFAGLADLFTTPLVLRRVGAAAPAPESEALGEDPSYNPYARED